MKEEVVVVDSTSPLAGRSCQACLSAVTPGDHAVVCPRCKTVHHLSCWVERGGCARLGCRQVARADLLPAKEEKPIRASKTPAWVIVAAAVFVVAAGVAIYRNARTQAVERANTTLVMIPASDDEAIWAGVLEALNGAPGEKTIELSITPDVDGGYLYEQKLVVMLAAKDGPEIVALTPERFAYFAERGALVPLDDLYRSLVESGFTLDEKRLDPVRVDGVLYGIPHPARSDILAVPAQARYPDDGKRALKRLTPELYKRFGGA